VGETREFLVSLCPYILRNLFVPLARFIFPPCLGVSLKLLSHACAMTPRSSSPLPMGRGFSAAVSPEHILQARTQTKFIMNRAGTHQCLLGACADHMVCCEYSLMLWTSCPSSQPHFLICTNHFAFKCDTRPADCSSIDRRLFTHLRYQCNNT
jgi:hypothetical protein